MKQKKAVVGIQFNWVFILIAGAVILIFFSTIVVRQKEQSEIKTSGIILTDLEAILTGAKVSTKAATSIDMPPMEIKFGCDSYSIGAVKKQIKTMTVFTPNRIKGRKLITWALDWNMPFTVTNFLYITSPEVRYIFVGTTELADKIYEMIPYEGDPLKPKINKELNPTPITDKNNYKVKFVYFGDSGGSLNRPPSTGISLPNTKNEDIAAIYVIPDATTNEYGKIEFYSYNGNGFSNTGESSPYITDVSLIAAIFAEDKEMYDCVMRKEFEKYKILVDIYKRRSNALAGKYVSGDCCDLHNGAASSLDSLSGLLVTFPISDTVVNSIKSNINSLELINKQLQSKSCVMVY